MRVRDCKALLGLLEGRRETVPADFDWYAAYGFAEAHKIAGLLSSRLPESAPAQLRRAMDNRLAEQRRRGDALRAWIAAVGGALEKAGLAYVFLKGSVLANADLGGGVLYEAGERTSNDIDLLVHGRDLTQVGRVLREMGFIQGRWDAERGEVCPLPRLEVLGRRMNRGETAPYLRAGEGALPFVEIDLNFSLGFLPNGDEELVEEMLARRMRYEGRLPVWGLSPEWNFLQLLLHQYKESAVYSMVERGKAYLVYKLLDIARMLERRLVDPNLLARIVEKYSAQKEACTVLDQVAELLDCAPALRLARKLFPLPFPEDVLDPPTGRVFRWREGLFQRLCRADCVRLLEECR